MFFYFRQKTLSQLPLTHCEDEFSFTILTALLLVAPSLAYAVPMCLFFILGICNFLFWGGRSFVLKKGLNYTVAQTQNSILFASS